MNRALCALASRCTACGLCDAAFTAYGDAARHGFRGPSDLPRYLARSDSGLAERYDVLVTIDREALAVAEAACPERIPLVALRDALVERAAELRGAVEPTELPRRRHDPG